MPYPSRSTRRVPSRRTSSWFFVDPVVSTLTTIGGTIQTSFNAAALASRPFTIIRLHMEILILSDQLAADELQVVAFGAAVVSDQSVAIGVTAIPTPATDAGSDLFFAHKWMINNLSLNTAAGYDSQGGRSYTIDSKAMRKVNDDQDFVTVVELDSISDGAIVVAAGRMLIKEH